MIKLKSLLLKENKLIKAIAIKDILPDKNNMETAVDSLRKGMYSDNNEPIDVYKDKNKYIVADGHHRLLQAIVNNNTVITANILPSDVNISRNGTIKLNPTDKYFGLSSILNNGWMINKL